MRLVTFERRGHRRLGAVAGTRIVDLSGAVGHPAFPSTMEALVARPRGTVLDAARASLDRYDVKEWMPRNPHVVAPILPPSLGADQHRWVVGPDAELPRPPGNGDVVFEPSIAAVVFSPNKKLKKREAAECIFGYTLMTYWSRGDEFAASLGPWIVTADEFDPETELEVRVNGKLWAQGTLNDAEASFGETVWAAAKQAPLLSGDVFWSGVLGPRRKLAKAPRSGSVVELSAEGLGTLTNTVGPRVRRRAAS
ncbi:MAG: fumarylacetoacetate hydrolase family protein [Actinomycetota bacterium]